MTQKDRYNKKKLLYLQQYDQDNHLGQLIKLFSSHMFWKIEHPIVFQKRHQKREKRLEIEEKSDSWSVEFLQ